MKSSVLAFLALVCLCVFASPAHAWDCTTPGQIRVQVPNGTVGNGTGDGSGQVVTVEGLTFECETPPSSTTTPTGGNSNASSTSSSTSNSQSTSNASSGSSSKSSATGGNATGGSATATGGSATGGNSSSTVSDSGNSSVTNRVTASGGAGGAGGAGGSATATGGNQKQNQTQSQTLNNSGNSSASVSGNGDNSNDSSTTINDPRQVATAIAPNVLPTTPCFKGLGVGGQGTMFGFSFGGGKIDENCARLEASRLAPSIVARCKIFITNKYAKEAGVTMDDCLPPAPVVLPPAPAVKPIAVTLNIQEPTINLPSTGLQVTIPPPIVPAPPSVAAAARANGHVHHVPCEPIKAPQGRGGCKTKTITNDDLKQ